MIFFFFDFIKEFFLHSILQHDIETVSEVYETKTSVDKSFDIMITKYTSRVLLAFRV